MKSNVNKLFIGLVILGLTGMRVVMSAAYIPSEATPCKIEKNPFTKVVNDPSRPTPFVINHPGAEIFERFNKESPIYVVLPPGSRIDFERTTTFVKGEEKEDIYQILQFKLQESQISVKTGLDEKLKRFRANRPPINLTQPKPRVHVPSAGFFVQIEAIENTSENPVCIGISESHSDPETKKLIAHDGSKFERKIHGIPSEHNISGIDQETEQTF